MSKKVLVLHGLAQNAEYFASKTKGFKNALQNEGYELIYATAPNELIPADIPDSLTDVVGEAGQTKILAWIKDDLENKTYKLPQTTLNYLHDFVIENGPFYGAIGFSQGAGVLGYLMTDFNGLLNLTPDQQPKLHFFIAFSGFRFAPSCYQNQYDSNPIVVPSLHVQGELDTVTESFKVEALYNSCTEETRTFIKHPGGHFVPNSKGFCKKVVDWLHQVCN